MLDASSFHSDDARRDKDITGRKFLDAGQHPTIAFRSTGCRRTDAGWLLDGVLRVRGHDSDVTLTLERAGGGHFVASAVVYRVAAGVATGRAVIARPVRIELDLYAA
ncbi:YceI family protein [Actinoplanes sp. TRM 88003]|uniref:YceI family protein n=1 Tax=Paractinoplanes aksuensis TaxID=2939490 RepID=A0ABT1DQK0_9ACTN|nr:YceI family protein [Actinoplanes aksuensis]